MLWKGAANYWETYYHLKNDAVVVFGLTATLPYVSQRTCFLTRMFNDLAFPAMVSRDRQGHSLGNCHLVGLLRDYVPMYFVSFNAGTRYTDFNQIKMSNINFTINTIYTIENCLVTSLVSSEVFANLTYEMCVLIYFKLLN